MTAENNNLAHDYVTFPRQFVSYRWFKPLLVLALGFVFMLLFQIVLAIAATIWARDVSFLSSISTGYDDMDPYNGPGALFMFGGIAVMLPALALAALIVRDRPYSSYSSSRGGWNWKAFAKCLGVAVVVLGVSTGIDLSIPGHMEKTFVNWFTLEGIVMCAVLIPIQCVAEEYVFRGFFMQAVGSWFKLPVVGLVVSSALFAAGHPYNEIGVVLIFFNGIIWGLMAWLTKGLEASSAAHIVNNYIAFFLAGFGVQATTSQVDLETLIVGLAVDVVYAVAVILLGRKFGWFEPKGDGAAAFNEEARARMAAKAARKQQQRPQPPQPLMPQSPQALQQPLVPLQLQPLVPPIPPISPCERVQQPQPPAAAHTGMEGEATTNEKSDRLAT